MTHRQVATYAVAVMQRPLSEHIGRLEEKIVILKRQLRDEDLPDYQRAERELDLTNAEQALMLFLKANELEQKLANDSTDSN